MRTPKFNDRLNKARKNNNLTMLAIAYALGISANQYWQLEHGYREANDEQKQKIAAILNVNVQEIF